MKQLLLHAVTFDAFWAHYCFYKDKHFIERLEALGYHLRLSSEAGPEEADWIIFSEVTSAGLHRRGFLGNIRHVSKSLLRGSVADGDLYAKCHGRGLQRMALLVLEGVVGLPENHDPSLGRLFPVVLTWNDTFVDGKRFFKYRWPQPVEWPDVKDRPYGDKKLLVNISGNKYAVHPLELYSERRRVIRHFEKYYPDDFDLYGLGWNAPVRLRQRVFRKLMPLYSSFKGEVQEKSMVFAKYRFAICYENAIVPGYITEKIFDCLRSNCVPVYLGAPNIADYVDASTFIDRRRFGSDEELGRFLADMNETEYGHYETAIRDYLAGRRFKSFLSPAFADTIVSVLRAQESV